MRKLFLDKHVATLQNICREHLDEHAILISVAYSYVSSGSGFAEILDNNHDTSTHQGNLTGIVSIVAKYGGSYINSLLKSVPVTDDLPIGHSC